MDYGIREGFEQGHLDVDFTSVRHSKVQNEPHELIDEWGDDRDSTWERMAQLNERRRMSSSEQNGKGLSVRRNLGVFSRSSPANRWNTLVALWVCGTTEQKHFRTTNVQWIRQCGLSSRCGDS